MHAMIIAQAVPILSDNYAWLLRDTDTGAVGVVDPADAVAVGEAIEAAGGRLDLILLTHHHDDHIAGVEEIRARYGAKVVGATADAHRLPRLDTALVEGDSVALGSASARVIDTPGHTRGHISFYFPDGGVLLCGDTLFSLGCGRLLEGTPAEMFASLHKFAALPAETLVCCGHEYTQSNARFALSADPDNAALQDFAARVASLRAAAQPTIPSRLGDEMAANPFLRAPDVATLADLRARKDKF
jgi:hydroxyacylglutathione hydrolase